MGMNFDLSFGGKIIFQMKFDVLLVVMIKIAVLIDDTVWSGN
jgi:hypothetical protein